MNEQIANQKSVPITFDMVDTVEKHTNWIEGKRFNKCLYKGELSLKGHKRIDKNKCENPYKNEE